VTKGLKALTPEKDCDQTAMGLPPFTSSLIMIKRGRGVSEEYLSAKYEFASSNTTRTTFAFFACFVWKLTPLVD
jgi:hypothetical protein